MMGNAKKVWEQLRRSDITREEQKNLMAKIMDTIGGKVQDVSYCIAKLKSSWTDTIINIGHFQAWCFSYDSNLSQEG